VARKIIEAPPAPSGAEQRLREAAVLLLLPGNRVPRRLPADLQPGDPGWSHADSAGPIQNLGGAVGAWIADIGLYFLGAAAYLIPLLALMGGWRIVHRRRSSVDSGQEGAFRLAGSALLLASVSALAWLHFGNSGEHLPHGSAGVFGHQLGIC
jgi:S-DNA-T family DNA segregation ATPase FtsK/SpoIIIE